MGRDESPADVQMTRAFIAVVVGLLLAFWVLIPECASRPSMPCCPSSARSPACRPW
jgi:hypothetical protein